MLSIITLFSLISSYFFKHPDKINYSLLSNILKSYYLPKGYEISWTKLNIKEHKNFYTLSTENLCLLGSHYPFKGCFDVIEMNFNINREKASKNLSIDIFELKGNSEFLYQISNSKGSLDLKKINKISLQKFMLPYYIEYIKLGIINIQVQNFIKESNKSQYSVKLDTKKIKNNELLWRFDVFSKDKTTRVELDTITKQKINEIEYLKTNIKAKLVSSQQSIHLNGAIHKRKNAIDYKGKIKILSKYKDIAIYIDADGSIKNKKGEGKLSLDIKSSDDNLNNLKVYECNYLSNLNSNIGEVDINCKGNFKSSYEKPHFLKDIELPDDISFNLHSKIIHPIYINENSKVDLLYTFKVDDFITNLYKIKGSVYGKISGKIDQKATEFKKEFKFNAFAKIPKFQEVVKTLKNSNYPIPTPFNSLKGSSEIRFKGDFNPFKKDSNLPFILKSKLSSKNQKIEVVADGKLTFKRKEKFGIIPIIRSNIFVKDAQLIAPNIDIFDIVSFKDIFPDPRFSNSRNFFNQDHPFEFYLNIKENSLLKLKSNLTKDPLTLNTSGIISSKDHINLNFSIKNTYLNLFNTNAKINEIRTNINSKRKTYNINGSLKFPINDEEVDLQIIAKNNYFRLIFDNENPLSTEEVIPYLLFGKDKALLSDDESFSSENFSSALESNQLSLSSFFVLAKIPISNISYNLAKEEYSAKINLNRNKAFLLLSTGKNTQGIGLKLRLSKHFLIETSYKEETDELSTDESSSTSTFLEWSNKYD